MRKVPRLSWARLVLILAAVAVGYFIFAATEDFFLSRRLERDEQQLRQEIADLKRQQAELESIRDYLQTDEYVEGVARRVLGLVRPGESLVIVSSTVPATPTPEQQAGEDGEKWWEELYSP